MEGFFGLVINMGLIELPEFEAYWSTKWTTSRKYNIFPTRSLEWIGVVYTKGNFPTCDHQILSYGNMTYPMTRSTVHDISQFQQSILCVLTISSHILQRKLSGLCLSYTFLYTRKTDLSQCIHLCISLQISAA